MYSMLNNNENKVELSVDVSFYMISGMITITISIKWTYKINENIVITCTV